MTDSYHVVPTVPKDDESPMSHAAIQDLVGNQHAEVKDENTSFREVGDDIFGGRSKEPKQQKSSEEHSLYNLARVELGEGKNLDRKPPTKPADSSLTNKGIALQKDESKLI